MRVHEYRCTQRAPSDRGGQIGTRWSTQIQRSVRAYRGHFADLGIDTADVNRIAEESLFASADWRPALGEEMRSVAAAAGVPARDVAMLNSRTEILAVVPPTEGECSTAVWTGPGTPPMAFQTWDWHASLVPESLMWEYQPVPGRTVKTFTELGMVAKIGMNSAGLTANFNILRHRSDRSTGGVPVHLVARAILDEAQTVQQAVHIARSAPVSASTVITVLCTGSGTPQAASIEISPGGVAVVPAPDDGTLVHTNHFVGEDLTAGGIVDPASTTHRRYRHLSGTTGRVSAGVPDRFDLPAVAGVLCGAGAERAPICMVEDPVQPPAHRWSTLLTVLMNPAAFEMQYYPGPPDEVAAGGTSRF